MDTKRKGEIKSKKPQQATQQAQQAQLADQVVSPLPQPLEAAPAASQEKQNLSSSMIQLAETITATSCNSKKEISMNQVHITLQGKGGVGKSLISSLIIQYLRGAGQVVTAIDTDPVNATLAGYKAFGTQRLELMDGGSLVERNFDRLIEQIVEEDSNFVVDNGASSFIPLSYYIAENDAFSIIDENGKQVVIHTVITGGQAMGDTLAGLKTIIDQMPGNAKLIVWLNEFFGDIVSPDGRGFEDLKVYTQNKDRIHGIVRIARQTGSTFGEDVKLMLDSKLTFDEINASTDFKLMSKSRLNKIKNSIFEQLAVVI